MKARALLLGCLWLAACSTTPPLPAPPADDPASPLADEAPERAPGQTLTMPAPPAAMPTSPRPARGH